MRRPPPRRPPPPQGRAPRGRRRLTRPNDVHGAMTMGSHENALLTLVDQKTKLASSNKMELLLLSLGGRESFGINVFKVREVCETPEITKAPNMPRGVEGIISLARKKIGRVLDSLGLPHLQASNGREAWTKLSDMAVHAQRDGGDLKQKLGLILVDAEMPEMDGYMLTQNIKRDLRFNGIPVVMHSSLSSVPNRKMGEQAGVDAYVAKFHADELASTLHRMLRA
jgi:CheY-like chemotaxis protein